MENKLKISENTVVHCETKELADKVLLIAHCLGYKWSSGSSYLEYNRWNTYGSNTHYNLFKGEFSDYTKDFGDDYIKISAQDFINLHDIEEQNIALYKKEMENAGYKFDTMTINDVKELDKYNFCENEPSVDEYVRFLDKQMEIQEGIKESNGKKDYSEINLEILDLMADRFAANKHKYPKGNMKKPIDVKSLEWALFRHIKKLVQPIENDEESYIDHLSAILCNASMILDQLHNEKTKS